MPGIPFEDLSLWASRSGVDLSQAELERIGGIATMYLERVAALQGLELERELSLSPDSNAEEEKA